MVPPFENSNSSQSNETGVSLPTLRVRFDEFEVDFAERELRRNGLKVKLQKKPFQILEFLLQKPGSLVTRSQLAKSLWPDLHVSFERCLNTAINSLRGALGDSRRTNRFVETCPGMGYRFIAPVEQKLPPADTSAARDFPISAAQRDYLTGRYFFDKMSDESLTTAIAHFESAIALDRSYGLPYAGLAQTYSLLAFWGLLAPKETAGRVQEYARSAQWLAPDSPEPYVALAGVKRIFEWDWAGAERLYKKALEINPSCEQAHIWYADLLLCQGRCDESMAQVRLSIDANPLSQWANFQLAWTLYVAGNSRAALEQAWRALVLDPNFAAGHHILGLIYQQMEMEDEALTELETACIASPVRTAALAALGHLHATTGSPEKARNVLQELAGLARVRYVPACCRALVYAGLGEVEASLMALEEAHENRDISLQRIWVDRRFRNLQQHPGFEALLVKAGLRIPAIATTFKTTLNTMGY